MRNRYIRGHCADSAPLLVRGKFEVEVPTHPTLEIS